MRISDWSSDVCSSDLGHLPVAAHPRSGGDPLAPARGGGAVKSFRDRNPYTVGLVSVLVIGAITGMAFLVGLLHLLEDTYEMEANFTDAAGLRGGDEVKLAGVKVGRLTGIEAARENRLVRVERVVGSGGEIRSGNGAEVARATRPDAKI